MIEWTNCTVKLGDLKPWADNPRMSTKAQAKRILDSFKKFGQVQVIAIGPENEVYDGHQRLSALLTIHGADHEVDARRSNRPLTYDERQELVAALHLGAFGSWNWDKLSGWDADLLTSWGADNETLKGWNNDTNNLKEFIAANEPEIEEAPEAQVDRAEELREKWQTETGQLWVIPSKHGGEHRLICGDCTDAAVVERVMGGEKAVMMFTDPPYNIEMKATSKDRCIQGIENDNMQDDDFELFVISFLEVSKEYVTEDVYVCCDWRNYAAFKKCMENVGWKIKTVIVWDKQTRAQNLNRWAFAHEFILYSGYFGTPTLDTNVWRFNREYSDVHLTPKPVEMIEKAIKTCESEAVYDPFLGSGTTVIACEQLGRQCRAIEISPAYVAVALERMAAMGLEPYLYETK